MHSVELPERELVVKELLPFFQGLSKMLHIVIHRRILLLFFLDSTATVDARIITNHLDLGNYAILGIWIIERKPLIKSLVQLHVELLPALAVCYVCHPWAELSIGSAEDRGDIWL